MRLSKRLLATTGVVIAICGAAFLGWQRLQSTPLNAGSSMKAVDAPVMPIASPVASQPAMPVAEHLPVGLAAPSSAPDVALDDSDALFRHALSGLMGDRARGQFFFTDQMVRKFVATVDNLPRQAAPMQMRPVKAMPGRFETSMSTGVLSMAPTNGRRYVDFIDAVSMVSLKSLVGLYAAHYALFQQAYRELGYPKGYFNDRLLVAIDDMLATEELAAPVALIQPKVLYEFADPDVESMSAGQKIMTRIGMSNGRRLRKLLMALRTEITRLDTGSATPAGKPP